ncbi:MAG: SGNH/GDSL hydrolase family protein [Bacteroides sp.]|nr:SGNH/GDSL hydrolase family protein [Bacteroides sp.]
MEKSKQTGKRLMKKNKKRICIGMMCCVAFFVHAQDPLPAPLAGDRPLPSIAPLAKLSGIQDTIEVYVPMPRVFRNTTENSVFDPEGILCPVWERMKRLRRGESDDTLRIVHIGDSHVRGGFFPQAAADKFAYSLGAVSYTGMGVNGATSLTFTHPDRIAGIVALNPELIVLSLGTNESHNHRYHSSTHYHQIDELVCLLKARLPDTPILLTTPPGSYEGYRGRRRTSALTINSRTFTVVKTICRYAQEKRLAVWDMYSLVGGEKDACRNWKEARLLRPDHIHYMPEGYKLQGELLYEALIRSYNAYVTR